MRSRLQVRPKRLVIIVLATAIYFAATRLGYLLALQPAVMSSFWISAGLAVAFLLVYGYSVWPAIAIGAFLGSLFGLRTAGLGTAGLLSLSIIIAAGNTLSAIVALKLLQHCSAEDPLKSLRTVLQFTALAAVIAPLISTTVGVAAACYYSAANWAEFSTLWATGWASNVLGTMVLVPVILALLRLPITRPRWSRVVVGLLSIAALGGLGWITSGPSSQDAPLLGIVLQYFVILLVIWITYQFRWTGAAVAVLTVVTITVWGVAAGYGLPPGSPDPVRFLLMIVYLTTVTLAAWALAGALHEQTSAIRQISQLSQFRQRIIENANVWINVLDEKANVIVWNAAAEAMSGYSQEEVIGNNKIWQWLYPEDSYRDYLLTKVGNTLRGSEVAEDFETTIRCKDGTQKIISWYERNLVDELGRPIGSVALGHDVTHQKQSEEALRQSEENFRALAENANDGILIALATAPHQHVYANQRVMQITGYANRHLLSTSLGDLFHHGVLDKFSTDFNADSEGISATDQYETTIAHKDGSNIPVEITSSITTWHGARAILVVVREIAERKRAEQALRESEEKYRLVTETARDIILMHDAKGRIIFLNRAGLEITGYSLDEALQLTVQQIVPSEYWSRLRQRAIGRRLGNNRLFNYEVEIIDKAGHRVPVEANSTPILQDAQVKAILVVARDITERKRLEADRQRLQDQLLEAQKMEAVGQLAGGIAHDFNNLLTAVNGYAELIQFQQGLDPVVHAMAGKILNAGERAAGLVRQLLAFASKQQIAPQVLNLNDEITAYHAKILANPVAGLVLEPALQVDLWPVEIDPLQVEQLINNLVRHARDSMPEPAPITVRTENVAITKRDVADPSKTATGDYVLLTVSHTGASITDDAKHRLFEPFFFTSEDVADGVGLRLAAVYGIVKQNRGYVAAESDSDNRIQYRVYLPRISGSSQPERA